LFSRSPTFDELSGRSDDHLSILDNGILLHREVVEPFRRLCAAAAVDGLDIAIASGYRDYDRQLAIWNAKAEGRRPLLDSAGRPLEPAQMSDDQIALAILRWSALPGCSRHHWGTDMDVWDRAAVDEGYQLQLVPEEYAPGGPFAALSSWLAEHAATYGFSRPYAEDRGGVAPEPWHLSYVPLARQFEARLDRAFIRKVLDNSELKLKAAVLARLDEIADRFILPRP